MADPNIKIKVDAVRCLDESNELSSSDEPFVIVFVADRSKEQFGFAIPSAKTTKYGPWDADEGDLLTTMTADELKPPLTKEMLPFISFSEYCWGPNGKAAPIADPDDLIILAGILENDDGSPTAARSVVNGLMAGSLGNMIGSGLTRAEMVSQLKKDMAGALTQARMTGAPDFDDRVGPVTELRLTKADVTATKSGPVTKKITINGGDDEGAYRIAFLVQRG